MKKRIIFIGHSYHQRTKSSQFMIDYLSEFYDVDVFYDESWNGNNNLNYSDILSNNCKVVLWQVFPERKINIYLKGKKVIFFPMYDASWGEKFKSWYSLRDIDIINFSNNLHNKLISFGLKSYYIKYFPKPKDIELGNINEAFFWHRTNNFDINCVLKILENFNGKIHIHSVLDPNNNTSDFYKDLNQENISYSDWFESKDDLHKLMKEKAIYIAPRLKEGIGMSFLEAMSMGKLVIANDAPTMNEYIENEKTGILFNYKDLKPINIYNLDIRKIQKNAHQYIEEGYKIWLNERKIIIDIINDIHIKKVNKMRLYNNLIFHFFVTKALKLITNIRLWFVFDVEKKRKIRSLNK